TPLGVRSSPGYPARSRSRRLRGGTRGGTRAAPPPRLGEEIERLRVTEVADELRGRLEPVLHEQLQVVALVEHLDLHVGIQLDQPARLAVLLGDELLVERGDLDVEVIGRKVEVGRERLRGVALAVALQHERARFVLPADRVEVEQLRELS